MKTPHRILPILALSAAFAIGLGVARAADEGGAKKDNPEANAGPKDNPEAKAGPKDSPEGKKGGEGDAKPAAAAQNSKEGKVFVAYDKDKNGTVSAEEIEGMLEGKQNSRGRREIRKGVDKADANDDHELSFEEFMVWMKNRRGEGG